MLLKLAWKNVWRNRLRSGIMVAAMVFGLLGVILMVGFVTAMADSMLENAIQYQTAHLQIHNPDFLVNEELGAWLPRADATAQAIKALPGVSGVTVRHVVDGMMASAASTRGVRINGINIKDEAGVTSLRDSLVEGRLLPEKGRNPILVSRRSAHKLNLRVGSKIVLTFSDIEGEVSGAAFRVCGFFNTPSSGFDESNVYVRRADLMGYTGLAQSHEIAVRLTDGDSIDALKPYVVAAVGSSGLVQDWGEVQPVLAALKGTMHISNSIIIGIFVMALGFGIINIMLMSVFERTREFGMLMAVGMTGGRVLRLVVMESLMLGGVGSLVGLAASGLMIAITANVGLPFGNMAEGLGVFGVDTVLYPEVPISTYLGTLAMLLVTSVLAALYPARQILKKRLSEALAEKH
ncbi:MAG: ABC transporter permease [Deltaproteobacteria bacterium]|nr:ABC transporter permease [Deltaproteobacteria bacterium]MBW2676126.1 ABC transporter permease [Deltaproteobacteria bacterium]